MFGQLVVLIHLDREWKLIGVVVRVYEAVVEEKARVTLFSVRVVHLLSLLNILHGFNYESMTTITVRPGGLSVILMVQHVCVGHQTVNFNSIDVISKDSTCNHHHNFCVLFKSELLVLRHLLANQIVVLLNVTHFLNDLFKYWTTIEPSELFRCVEDWKIVEGPRKCVKVLGEE